MSSAQRQSLALAHAAIENALYFLEINAHHRAIPHLEFAAQKYRQASFRTSEQAPMP